MSSQPEMNGRAIIVLGMHRSGTSMLARCIHLLGADIARQVIPTDTAINRDGFFEDAKVVALNDDLLATLASCWYDFRPLPHQAAEPQRLELWQSQALAHIQEEYASKRLSVVKDPRMSRLWNYWAPIFEQAGLGVDLVHIIRRPEHVALSLKRRNGMPLAYGLLLWCAHIVDTLSFIDSEAPWTTLFYDSFLSDPHRNIELIVAMLGPDVVAEPDYAYLAGEIGKPRSSASPSSEDALVLIQDLHDFAAQLYQFLENNCNDGKLVIARQEAERLNNEYEQLLSRCAAEFKMLEVLTNELISLSSKLVEIGELHSQAQNVVAERDSQLAGLNGELTRVGAELGHAQSVVVERDRQLADLSELFARFIKVFCKRVLGYVRRASP